MVLSEVGFVVEQQLLGDGLGVGAALGQGVVVASAQGVLAQHAGLAVVVGLLDVILLLAVAQRRGEHSGDGEVLERSDDEGGLAVEGVALSVVEAAGMDAGIGIGAVVARAHGAVGPDSGIDGVVLERGLHRVDLVVVRQLVVESHVEGRADEVVDLDVVVQAGGVLFHVAAHIEGVFVLIGEHGAALDVLVAVGDAHAVLVLGSPFCNHEGVPVGQRIAVRIEGVVSHVVVYEVLFVLEVVAALGVACIVPLGFVLKFHEACRAHLLGMAGTGQHGEASVVVYAHLAFLGALGGDEDHTCACTGAVDGGGCSVFQDGDVLDGVNIHIVNGAHGHAVNDDQRVGIADGGDTAHADGSAGTRQAAGSGDLHARHGALEGLAEAYALDGGEFAAVHGCYGSGEIFLLNCTVTDDHNLVQEFVVILHGQVNNLAGAYGLLHGLETYAGKLEHCVFRFDRQGVLAVHVCGGAVGGSFLHYSGPDHRQTVFIDDSTRDPDLCIGGDCAQCKGQECDQNVFFHAVIIMFVV